MKVFASLVVALGAMGIVSAHEGNQLVARSPDGCVSTFDGPFQATIVDLSTPMVKKRSECGSGSQLMVTLEDGVLKDAMGRTGYIAGNFQFQFDDPPQSGTLKADGFSVCANGSIALGESTLFYQCASGTFFNLYDRDWAYQCSPVHIEALPCDNIKGMPEHAKDMVVGTMMKHTTLVTVLEDGQPQVVPTEVPVPICQIDDGQIQGHTTPCAEVPPPLVTTGAPDLPADSGAPPAPTADATTGATPPASTSEEGDDKDDEEEPSGTGGNGSSPSSPAGADDEEEPTESDEVEALADKSSPAAMMALVVCLVTALVA